MSECVTDWHPFLEMLLHLKIGNKIFISQPTHFLIINLSLNLNLRWEWQSNWLTHPLYFNSIGWVAERKLWYPSQANFYDKDERGWSAPSFCWLSVRVLFTHNSLVLSHEILAQAEPHLEVHPAAGPSVEAVPQPLHVLLQWPGDADMYGMMALLYSGSQCIQSQTICR